MKFKERILKQDASIDHVPSGFKRYGNVMILRSQHQLSPKLGKIISTLYPWCQGVFQHVNTLGESRKPQLIHLAGDNDPIVVHKENGVRYHLDLSKITFSGGNRHLRERLLAQVKDGEFLLDMFAGVGNLSLQPLVYRNIDAVLIEKNLDTFKYLQSTLKLNDISTQIALNMDCRDLAIKNQADRILMGYHNVDVTHLDNALTAASHVSFIHLHPLAKYDYWSEWINYYSELVQDRGYRVISTEVNKVKNYSPGLEHIEIILQITK